MFNNRVFVEYRLKFFKKRFCRDLDLFGKYLSVIDDYFYKGYCERVLDSLLSCVDGMVWYLLYYFVFYFVKFEKIRVVFDCVVKYVNILLNDFLL